MSIRPLMHFTPLGLRLHGLAQCQPCRNRATLAGFSALGFGLVSTANFVEGHFPLGIMFGSMSFLYSCLAFKFSRARRTR